MKVLFIITLVALSYGMQMSKQLPSLQNNNFGTLFSEIKSQIKAGGPLANIEGLLDDLKEQIHHEQREHDDMLARNSQSCAGEKEFRDGEIQEGSAALRRATNHLGACSSSEEKAKVDLTQTNQDIADSRAALSVAQQRRDEGHQLFIKRSTDHRNALNVIKGSLNIMDDLVAEEASLAQLSAHTSMLLQTGVRVGLSHHYAPVIALFAQMATSEFDMFLDAGSVGRVRNMLEQLYENVEKSLEDFANEESAAQDNFNTLKGKLQQSVRDLEENATTLEDHLEEMAQCVLEEKLLVAKSSEKVDRNTNLLRLTNQMCEAFVEEYNAATESRKEEQELLKTVRKMVKRRLENVGSSVRQRDDHFREEKVDSYEKGEFKHQGGKQKNALEGFGMDF